MTRFFQFCFFPTSNLWFCLMQFISSQLMPRFPILLDSNTKSRFCRVIDVNALIDSIWRFANLFMKSNNARFSMAEKIYFKICDNHFDWIMIIIRMISVKYKQGFFIIDTKGLFSPFLNWCEKKESKILYKKKEADRLVMSIYYLLTECAYWRAAIKDILAMSDNSTARTKMRAHFKS